MCGLTKIGFTNQKYLFPLPFLDSVLDIVVKHKIYYFMDGYNGHNEMKMVEEDKKQMQAKVAQKQQESQSQKSIEMEKLTLQWKKMLKTNV